MSETAIVSETATAIDTAIAIDMGGSHVTCGIVRGDCVLAAKTIPVEDARLGAVLPKVESAVFAVAEECGVKLNETLGIAVGICAIVDAAGTVLATNGKYDDACGFSFSEWGEARFGLRCRAENDARLALLGEHFAGAARDFDDVVLVTLGTGIGGAVMLGGKLLSSRGRRAGAMAGHLGVDWQGGMCTCGNRGCAEAEASTVMLDAWCRGQEGFAESALAATRGAINFLGLFSALDEGDAFALGVLDRCIGVWSALAVSLIHAYDPQVIVFGGGIMRRHATILPVIRAHVERHAWAEKGSIRMVPSMLGSSSALLGAIPLLRGVA